MEVRKRLRTLQTTLSIDHAREDLYGIHEVPLNVNHLVKSEVIKPKE